MEILISKNNKQIVAYGTNIAVSDETEQQVVTIDDNEIEKFNQPGSYFLNENGTVLVVANSDS